MKVHTKNTKYANSTQDAVRYVYINTVKDRMH